MVRVCNKCIACDRFLTCKDDDRCKNEPESTRRDVSFREFSSQDSLLEGITYDSVITTLSRERNIGIAELYMVAKREIDIRMQDFWYLMHLNEEEIMKRAKEGRSV